jgi:hypothetical protein
MGERETTLAETEVLFREVNEGIAAAAERFEADEADFVCECSDAACARRVTAPLAEYERVRRNPTHFLLAVGHGATAFERVVRRGAGLEVVEKVEAAMRRIVVRLDPRRRRTRPG